uniref:YARHG domain-containing protein n=1 Tax=Bosea sp. NBC_00436 TaxID=2969620 RepID=A0A9E7ZUF3_9HYPH
MRRALLRTALVSFACFTAFAAGAANGRFVNPADRAENRTFPMNGNLPGCDDPAVLGRVTSHFNSREDTYWGPLQALSYDRIAQIGYRSWGADFIPRRFCSGRVLLNDGKFRRVDYSVRESLGLFGMTWNVNWCVNGLDRERTYAPDCKMARP